MKSKNLLYMLFALTVVFASCNKNNPIDENDYLLDEKMAIAVRLSSAEYSLPENYYYLNFYNSTGEMGVSVLLVGEEKENTLQPGTYTASDNNLQMEECAVFSGEDVYQCYKGDGTVVVTGDAKSYSFDIDLSDGQRKFHFTYSGAVEGISIPEPEPEVPDNNVYFTATTLMGMHMSYGSSNVDSYVVAFSDEEQTYSYQLALYNTLGEVDDKGYVTLPSGTYTLGDTIEEFIMASYSCLIVKDSTGANSFSFTEATLEVTETQTILTAVIEGVTHVMTFNGPISIMADLPEPPVDFEASYAYAYYAAQKDGKLGIFKLYLSDLGLDANGNNQANGTYYEFTILISSLDSGAEIAIPAGTYEIKNYSSEPGVISNGDYYKHGENAQEIADSDMISGGYLTINEDGTIEGECEMMFSGATHTLKYSGDIEILENVIPSEPPYSTLTADKVCDFSKHGLSYMDMGDAYNTGCQTWTVSISGNDASGDHVVFELLAGEYGKSDLFGRYTVSDTMGEYTALPGYVDGFTLMNSWYYYRPSIADISDFAPVVSGWVEISENTDGTVTIAFDVCDDQNNNITGSWTSSGPAITSSPARSAVRL